MLFKESPDRSLIQKAHQHCVQQHRSLSHEFNCLNGLFGLRQRRGPELGGQPRKYLLRRIERPLILRPRQRPKMPPKRQIEPASVTETESEQWSLEEDEEQPMDRIVFQFAHTAPDTDTDVSTTAWSVTEEETTTAIDWAPEPEEDDLLAETCAREQAEEAQRLRERYDEYMRSTATQSQSEMECELRSIQTLQIVVGENTIYCQ